ncbi:1579_t:CDS:2, partial [Acaulospora colombiana]
VFMTGTIVSIVATMTSLYDLWISPIFARVLSPDLREGCSHIRSKAASRYTKGHPSCVVERGNNAFCGMALDPESLQSPVPPSGLATARDHTIEDRARYAGLYGVAGSLTDGCETEPVLFSPPDLDPAAAPPSAYTASRAEWGSLWKPPCWERARRRNSDVIRRKARSDHEGSVLVEGQR